MTPNRSYRIDLTKLKAYIKPHIFMGNHDEKKVRIKLVMYIFYVYTETIRFRYTFKNIFKYGFTDFTEWHS